MFTRLASLDAARTFSGLFRALPLTLTAACSLSLMACSNSDHKTDMQDAHDGGAEGDGDRDKDFQDAEVSPDASDPSAPTLNLPTGALQIRAAAAGERTDPENSAPKSAVQKLSWRDASARERSMILGAYLYQYDFNLDDNKQVIARSAGDDAYGHAGFGYVVSHNSTNGNSPLGKKNAASRAKSTVFEGAHHAIHRVEFLYDRNQEGGGNGLKIPVVIDWFVATGRDHPVWAVTFKMDEVENPQNVNLDAYRMDTRAPYGSLNFDGAPTAALGDAIGGVSWGDADYAFTTLGNGLSLNSAWTYNQESSVNFVRAWTKNANAEFGIVQTRPGDRELTYGDRVVGRERSATSAGAYLGKGDCTGLGDNRNYVMPCIGGWPYQLMNYDWAGAKPLAEETSTKLLAWGSPYGYLGASSFDKFDYSGKADGRGDRSYATFIVLGPKCRFDALDACNEPGDVAWVLSQVEALAAAQLDNVATGSVSASAAKGPGAKSEKPLSQGYNDTYAAYYLTAEENQVAFRFTPAAAVDRPIFVIQNYAGALPEIRLGGELVAYNGEADASGAFVSYRAEEKELWVTLNRSVAEPLEFSLKPKAD